MFRSQGQESTASSSQPLSWTGRALVLEIKHEADYTRRRAHGQTGSPDNDSGSAASLAPQVGTGMGGGQGSWSYSSARTSLAPAPRAASLARATSRDSGTMPQLVHG